MITVVRALLYVFIVSQIISCSGINESTREISPQVTFLGVVGLFNDGYLFDEKLNLLAIDLKEDEVIYSGRNILTPLDCSDDKWFCLEDPVSMHLNVPKEVFLDKGKKWSRNGFQYTVLDTYQINDGGFSFASDNTEGWFSFIRAERPVLLKQNNEVVNDVYYYLYKDNSGVVAIIAPKVGKLPEGESGLKPVIYFRIN